LILLALKIPVSVVRFHPWPPISTIKTEIYEADHCVGFLFGAVMAHLLTNNHNETSLGRTVSQMPQLLPFTPSDMCSHFRP